MIHTAAPRNHTLAPKHRLTAPSPEIPCTHANVGRAALPSGAHHLPESGSLLKPAPTGQDGLCHISELDTEYVKSADQVVKIGDTVRVKVLSIDDQGRIKLSRKAAVLEEAVAKSN